MRNETNIKLKGFQNYFCDGVASALGEFIDVYNDYNEEEILKKINIDELKTLIEYSVLKNKIAGVKFLNIKVPMAFVGREALEKFELEGNEILSARVMPNLSTKDLLGGRLILHIEDLLDYEEGYLESISDFCGRTDIPVMISLGQDLEEVGKLVNKYNKSPVEVLEDFGFLDRECYLQGLNFIDKEDQKLLMQYNPTLILSPRDDGESGKGAINLFNLIYNRLKFVFSSGRCYNIDMLGEAKLANLNTQNLMFRRGLIEDEKLLESLQWNNGEVEIPLEKESNLNCIFDFKYVNGDSQLQEKLSLYREKIKEIIKRIKE